MPMPVRSGAKDMVGVSFVVGVRCWCVRWRVPAVALEPVESDGASGPGIWRDDRGTGSVRSPLRLPRTRFGHYSTVVTGVSTPVHPRPFPPLDLLPDRRDLSGRRPFGGHPPN